MRGAIFVTADEAAVRAYMETIYNFGEGPPGPNEYLRLRLQEFCDDVLARATMMTPGFEFEVSDAEILLGLSTASAQALYDHTGTMPWAPGSWTHTVRRALSDELGLAALGSRPLTDYVTSLLGSRPDVALVDAAVDRFAEPGRPTLPELVILRGLPASGKTTWAERWVAVDATRRARVNKDTLRLMLHAGIYLGRETEAQVDAVRDAAIAALLRAGISVVSDDTNLDRAKVDAMRELAAGAGAMTVAVLYEDTPVDECVRRDALREKPVGEAVIRDLHSRYIDELGSGR